jgi:hypothetical protein
VIVAAAIKYLDKIHCGKRHASIMASITQQEIDMGMEPPRFYQNMQGFVDDDGNFHSREFALSIAKRCKQIPISFDRVLTSEDLW